MEPTPRARMLALALLLIAAVAVGLMLAEGALRIVAQATDRVRGAVYDERLGWRLVPGITKLDPQWSDRLPATTNSMGWRDAEFTLDAASGQTRIAVLGDSFTFGYGVDYGQRFSEVLEATRPDLDVLNMGVFAYGPDQELLVYTNEARPLHPDIVLLDLFLGNDLDDIRARVIHSFPKPVFVPTADSLTIIPPSATFGLKVRSWSYLGEAVARVVAGAELRTEPAPELESVDEVELLLALLNRLASEVQADRARLLVAVIHPGDATPRERARQARAAEAISQSGVDVVDLRAPFDSAAAAGGDLYLSDGHWRPEGHRLFAQVLEAELAARGWIDPEP